MIPKELDALRPTRERTLALTRDLTQEQLDFKPAPDKWSAGEVLDHIPLVEGSLRKEIEILIELAEEGRATTIHRGFDQLDISVGPIPKSLLKFFTLPFTLSSMMTPKPVLEYLAKSRWIPFKNPEAAEPRPGRLRADLRRDLAESLQTSLDLIESHPDIDYPELVLRHPLMGSNSVPDILRFLVSHEQRHQAQIRDVLATSGFPAPREEAA